MMNNVYDLLILDLEQQAADLQRQQVQYGLNHHLINDMFYILYHYLFEYLLHQHTAEVCVQYGRACYD